MKLLCHCFHFSYADIEQDIMAHGRSLLLEKILAAKKKGQCQCVVKNPTGK